VLGLELGSVLGLLLGLVIFRSKKSADPHVRTSAFYPWPGKARKGPERRPFRAPHRRRDIAKYVVPYLLKNANGFELVFNRHDRNRMAELKLLLFTRANFETGRRVISDWSVVIQRVNYADGRPAGNTLCHAYTDARLSAVH